MAMMRNFLLLAFALSIATTTRAENWPSFRGPTGQGISTETGLPTMWSATENISWKTPIPGAGYSSPIVWGDRVFVTTVTDDGESCRILAISTKDGAILWNVEVFRQMKTFKQPQNSYATPTPATDGAHVFAVFSEGGIAAVTVDGKRAWVNQDVKHYSQHGLGSSPVLYRDTLIMPYDGSSKGPDKGVGWQSPWDQAFLLAVDKATGREKWRAKRGLSRIAHTTPVVANHKGRDVLLSTAGDVIQEFNPQTGARLWTVRAEGEGVTPTVVVGEGLIFASSGFGNPRLRAVKLDRDSDDATRTVVWETKKNVPMIPSAVYVKPNLFTVSEKGMATCFDAATGKVHWEQRLEGTFAASPVSAEGRVYFLSEAGETTVIQARPEFMQIARNGLNEPCQASMAVSGEKLFIRTRNNLYCIGRN
jgi:outer membrane protein assembly factor BamB